MCNVNRKGFTLIEAIASAALLAVGIAACLIAVGAVTNRWSEISTQSKLQQLADRKLDDLIAQADDVNPDQGDFSTWNLPEYRWSSAVQTTQEQELNDVTVTVWNTSNPSVTRSTEELLYVPPTSTTGTP